MSGFACLTTGSLVRLEHVQNVPVIHGALGPPRGVEVLDRVRGDGAAPPRENQVELHRLFLARAPLYADALGELLRDASNRAIAVLFVRGIDRDL